jgi:hypothetical protein
MCTHKEKLKEKWRKLHNAELHNLFLLLFTDPIDKCGVGRVAKVRKQEMLIIIRLRNLTIRDY